MASLLIETDHDGIHRALLDGLHAFNQEILGPYEYTPLSVALRDEEGKIVGGASGGTHLGWLALSLLWVSEDMQGRGWGSRLLAMIEEEARRHGATRAYLDTFSFQAPGFYVKQGYVVEARIRDFAGGDDRIYMTKRSL